MRMVLILHIRAPAINALAHSHLYKVMMVTLMFVTPAINEPANLHLLVLFLLTALVNVVMMVVVPLRVLIYILIRLFTVLFHHRRGVQFTSTLESHLFLEAFCMLTMVWLALTISPRTSGFFTPAADPIVSGPTPDGWTRWGYSAFTTT